MKYFAVFLLTLLLTGVLSLPSETKTEDENEKEDVYPDENYPVEDSDYVYSDDDDLSSQAVESTSSTTLDPPEFEESEGRIVVRENEPFEISCKTITPTGHTLMFQSGGSTFIYVGWIKILSSSRFVKHNDTFRIDKANRKDAGDYQCLFQLETDRVSKNYTVEVKYAPSIRSKSKSNQRVVKGETVTFECTAVGYPAPEITWTKVGGKLPSGAKTETGLSIALQEVDRHVEGTYTCTADNGIGKPASASMKLTVDYPPEIFSEKEIIRTVEGNKVQLVCVVHSRPQATVTWSKDGVPLSFEGNYKNTTMGHRHSIDIFPVTNADFGSYNCTATNDEGSESEIINLSDRLKQPIFTSDPASAEETSYTLTWKTESYYPVKGYTLKYRPASENNSNEWMEVDGEVNQEQLSDASLTHELKHMLTDLQPATSYETIVIVRNEMDSETQATFTFSTKQETADSFVGGGAVTTLNTALIILSLLMKFMS